MKVLIISVNSKYIHSSPAPWFLKQAAEDRCRVACSVTVSEGTINEAFDTLAERFFSTKYDVFAFSCYIWNIACVRRLITAVKKKYTDSKIIIGGPEVSFCREEALRKSPETDFLISGEGEEPFSKLLDSINKKVVPTDISGISFILNGVFHDGGVNLPSTPPDLADTEGYIANLHGRISYVETVRGCPFSCAFCLSGRHQTVRALDTNKAKELLVRYANESKTVKLVDRTFNYNKKRSDEIMQFLIENRGRLFPSDVCFHFEVGADLFDDESLGIIKSAPDNLFQFEAGIQSLNESVLEKCNRHTDIQRLMKNLSCIAKMKNTRLHVDLISGLPTETFDMFCQSFDLVYRIKPSMLQLGRLKLIYGSALRTDAEKYGYVFKSEPPYEVISSDAISRDEIEALNDAAEVLNKMYNSGRMIRTCETVMKYSGKSPSHFFLYTASALKKYLYCGVSLDVFTDAVYSLYKKKNDIPQNTLRNAMVCDRLSSNSSGKLTRKLFIPDKKLAVYTQKISKKYPGRIGTAMLYGYNPSVAVADYSKKDPVTGRYFLETIPVSEIKKLV